MMLARPSRSPETPAGFYLTRYTHPEPDQQLLLAQLGWGLPGKAPPRISAKSLVAV